MTAMSLPIDNRRPRRAFAGVGERAFRIKQIHAILAEIYGVRRAPLTNKTGHSSRPAPHYNPFENRPAADNSDFRIVNLHLTDH